MAERGTPTEYVPETQAGPHDGDATLDGAAGDRPSAPITRRFTLPDRYAFVERIASGAFGEVWRVRDSVLDRVLAMKVLRAELVRSQHMRARFLTEARITADLQHPGIVAVHDQGELPDGRLWFTMKEVRGRTLRQVIDEVHAASGPDGFREAASGWTFRRMLDGFARIAQAVAFAHRRGVMHRDLKPENIMVGEFGEVLVMDWGLARRVDGADSAGDSITEDLPADLTRSGDVLGTPAYMPPEQARGQRELHGPASDVYALGAILYHLLSGRMPYEGSGAGVLRQVQTSRPLPLAEALRGRPAVPAELVIICERAMAREIADRWPDAEPLSREVTAFLDGARRREQALSVLDRARALTPEIAALRDRAARCRQEAHAILAAVQPFEPVEKKRPGWDLEDEAARLGRDAALREIEWTQTVYGALSLDPELPEAHALLADHYRERLTAAELARHDEDAARFEALLRPHDRGRHAAFLRGEGALTLLTDPPGAVVRVERYELTGRHLTTVDEGVLGETPLAAAKLTRGSSRLRVSAPGCAEIFYPVQIDRGGHWDGRAPGADEPTPIRLPRAGELGPDDCYVPAGYCWTGGDPQVGDGLPLTRVWVDGYVLRRFAVTNAEYIAFLNDLLAQGREEEANLHLPRGDAGLGGAEHVALRRDTEGRFVLDTDAAGRKQEPDWPLVLVDWHASRAYARWLAAKTGLPWRLPHELEREKATRGVDGRRCPWGDHLDATFACVVESHPGDTSRAGPAGFPIDESPYGIRHLAGNTRDWCGHLWRHEGPRIEQGRVVLEEAASDDPTYRSVRGGAWCSASHYARAASRFAARPDVRRVTTGLRLARSL